MSVTIWKECKSRNLLNEIRICLPSASINESVARSAVAAFCAQADPNGMEIADIKCAVSEAVTNSIVHGYKDRIGPIYIQVKLYEGRILYIQIKDRGCGIEDVRKAREPLYTTDAANERSGMGFTVMESFCDEVYVRSKTGSGTTVTLLKRLEGR